MTIEIPLTQGAVALADDEDADRLNTHRWHCKTRKNGTRYAGTNIKRTCGGYRWVSMHRFLLNPPSDCVVDHADGDGLNNRRTNLRVCTQAQNMANRRAYGTSKYLGVHFDKSKPRHPWAASCGRRRIGAFASEIEAAAAYDHYATEAYGTFARLNFPGSNPSFDRTRLRDGKARKSKLTVEQIREIRALAGTQSQSSIGTLYGVSHRTVGLIAAGKMHADI